ncbi:MAG TPA: VOC family protein [Paraburkholderia sp.]|jgi:catechol 2,3-dioxygenase-like lactoylglutathione lyase family enzyme|uniref:VOC family protein n=1 Tax=Paraburkholderia sp. TaxID=1926495 RepID=UPI002DE6BA8E|nr:VOC family protein [Paraburkholderia sp.]
MSTQTLTAGIDHVGLTAKDLAATSAFFIDCLGWRKVGERPEYPAIFVSDGHVLVTLWQRTDADHGIDFDRKANIGLHHLALRAASEAAFETLFERVSNWPGARVEFGPELLGNGPKRHMMVYEPGGIRIEFDITPAA